MFMCIPPFVNIGGDQGINQTNLKITTSGEQQARSSLAPRKSQASKQSSFTRRRCYYRATGRYFLLYLWSSLIIRCMYQVHGGGEENRHSSSSTRSLVVAHSYCIVINTSQSSGVVSVQLLHHYHYYQHQY